MASEIIEVDESTDAMLDKEAEKTRIRQIIDYQKSMYLSSSTSSSFSSVAASSSSFSSPRKKRSSLLDLMKEGSTSLGRLFDMEHTSLGNYLKDYSLSPEIKPILLWGSDSDDIDLHVDPWEEMKQIKEAFDSIVIGQVGELSSQTFKVFEQQVWEKSRKLYRVKSYRRLPRFRFWKCGMFRFKFRLIKRLRIMIRSRKL